MLRHKFNAKPTEYQGVRYASKKEAHYAMELDLRVKAGEVLFYLRQVPFDLPGNTKYRADFMEFLSSGEVKVIDVKGHITQEYKTKKRMVEALYPVKIIEC